MKHISMSYTVNLSKAIFIARKLCDSQILSFIPSGGCRLLSGLEHQKFFFGNGMCMFQFPGQVIV